MVSGDCSDAAESDSDGAFDCYDGSCAGTSDCDPSIPKEDDDQTLYDPTLIGEPVLGASLFQSMGSYTGRR